jgi:hypothetical protein
MSLSVRTETINRKAPEAALLLAERFKGSTLAAK